MPSSNFMQQLPRPPPGQASGQAAPPEAPKQGEQAPTPKGGRQHEDLQLKYGGLDSVPPEQITTLMIRHLPRRYTEEELILELEAFITPDMYNFLYLPWDNRRSSNVGYAFLNFVNAETARLAQERLDGKPWRLVQTTKEMKIMPAHVQGIALNLLHYMGSSVVEDGHPHSPMVIQNGHRVGFQEAVQMYCTPEMIEMHSQRMEAGLPAQGMQGISIPEDHLPSQHCKPEGQPAQGVLGMSIPEDHLPDLHCKLEDDLTKRHRRTEDDLPKMIHRRTEDDLPRMTHRRTEDDLPKLHRRGVKTQESLAQYTTRSQLTLDQLTLDNLHSFTSEKSMCSQPFLNSFVSEPESIASFAPCKQAFQSCESDAHPMRNTKALHGSAVSDRGSVHQEAFEGPGSRDAFARSVVPEMDSIYNQAFDLGPSEQPKDIAASYGLQAADNCQASNGCWVGSALRDPGTAYHRSEDAYAVPGAPPRRVPTCAGELVQASDACQATERAWIGSALRSGDHGTAYHRSGDAYPVPGAPFRRVPTCAGEPAQAGDACQATERDSLRSGDPGMAHHRSGDAYPVPGAPIRRVPTCAGEPMQAADACQATERAWVGSALRSGDPGMAYHRSGDAYPVPGAPIRHATERGWVGSALLSGDPGKAYHRSGDAYPIPGAPIHRVPTSTSEPVQAANTCQATERAWVGNTLHSGDPGTAYHRSGDAHPVPGAPIRRGCVLGGHPLPPPPQQNELQEVLSSDAYIVAWQRLNDQLELAGPLMMPVSL